MSVEPNSGESKEIREWYESNRAQYLDRIEIQQTLFDKTLILLSSGAIAGLISLVDTIGLTFFFKATFCSFLLSIASSMLSLVFSVQVHQSFLGQFDKNVKNGEYGKILSSNWEKWVRFTNWTTLTLAIIGTAMIVALLIQAKPNP